MTFAVRNGNDRIWKFTGDGMPLGGWGSSGTQPGQFNDPVGIVADQDGNLYVSDLLNHRVQKLSPNGVALAVWDLAGTANGQPVFLAHIAIDNLQNVYATDFGTHRVLKLAPDGSVAAAWGSLGAVPFRFTPFGGNAMAVDDDGAIYVADVTPSSSFANPASDPSVTATFDRIVKVAWDGTPLMQWGTLGNAPGEFNLISGLAVGPDGNLYVSESWNHRVQKFTRDGVLLRMWGGQAAGPGEFNKPGGIAVDRKGVVFVSDSLNNRIQAFTSDGALLGAWGAEGGDIGQLRSPRDVVVDPVGNIYVADSGNSRIQKFSPTGEPLASWSAFGRLAADERGDIFVADCVGQNMRIQMLPAGRKQFATFPVTNTSYRGCLENGITVHGGWLYASFFGTVQRVGVG